MKLSIVTLTAMLVASPVMADSNLDAAIGGGLGGAAGAVIGNEVGGRDGAIIGGAIGGATGTAISTNKDRDQHLKSDVRVEDSRVRIEHRHRHESSFCPPGQAKKGRC